MVAFYEHSSHGIEILNCVALTFEKKNAHTLLIAPLLKCVISYKVNLGNMFLSLVLFKKTHVSAGLL